MHRFAVLEGEVRGHLNDHYTCGLNVTVVLAVQAANCRGQSQIWEVTTAGLGMLQLERADIHATMVAHWSNVHERPSEQWGDFRFDGIPVGPWSYVLRVDADKLGCLGQHTDWLGYDGQRGRNALDGHDLAAEGKRSGIIIPVFDRWYQDSVALPYKKDPPTDPKHIVWGVLWDA